MKVIRRYTIMQLGTTICDDAVDVSLHYGEISGPCYSRIYPQEEFDTEEEAIKYAYDKNKFSNWIIVPLITFDWYDE